MVRPREFDEAEAVEQAMLVFWEKGFQPTTPQNLLDVMGLSKSSFYETFGSKRELFLRCLQHYISTGHTQMEAALGVDDVRVAFGSILDFVIEMSATKNGARCGCMLCNTAAELSPHDKEVEQMVRKSMSSTEKLYIKRLHRAQQDGQISEKKDTKTLARYFTSSTAGLQLMAKVNPNRSSLKGVAKVILSTLE